MTRITYAAAFLLCAASPVWSGAAKTKGPDLQGKTVAQVFTEVLPGLGLEDMGARQNPQQRWQEICLYAGAPGNETLRKEVCDLMVAKLDAKTPALARVWLLTQLTRIGRGECVNAVATQLADEDVKVHDTAVRCLAANPAAEASGKLAERLSTARGVAKVAVLNALAYRADKSAVDAVKIELGSSDDAIVSAAANVLAKIGTAEAAGGLKMALAKSKGRSRLAIGDAYLHCADRALADGKTDVAATIYRELHRAEEPRPLRLAALRGVLRSGGDQAGTQVLEIFAGKDRDAQAVAISEIESLNPAALKTVATGMDKLPTASQIIVLGALAGRGDRSQLPVALAAAKSSDKAISHAGYLALGKLGDVSVVPMLIESTFANNSASPAARESLMRVAGDGVDQKLVAAFEAEKDNGRRGNLISILEERKAVAALPALLTVARGSEAGVRGQAMRALRQLAEPKDVPVLVQALLKADAGKEREDAEVVLAAVCGKIPEADQRAEPILAVAERGSAVVRAALLPVLGRLGGPKALEAARAALADGDPALVKGAAQALCNWPDATASADLLRLAQGGSKEQSVHALHALVRVTAQPNDASQAVERLAVLQKATEIAPNLEEKRRVIEALGSVKSMETLRFVLPYLDDKDLNQAACKAVVELAHSRTLRDPNQAEFVRVLDRVIPMCRDAGLVERAKQYRAGR